MVLQKKYRKSPEAVQSFDFKDVAQNQAYLEYFAAFAPPSAKEVRTNYETGYDEDYSVPSTYTVAQTFKVTAQTSVTKIELYLKLTASGTSSCSVEIQGVDGSGNPDGTALTDSDGVSINTTSYNWFEFSLRGGVLLEKDTTYCILLKRISGNATRWGVDGSSPGYTNGTIKEDSGGWGDLDKDAYFRVYGYTGQPYVLTTEAFDPLVVQLRESAEDNSSTFTKYHDVDFDSKIGAGITITGKGYVESTVFNRAGTGSVSDTYLIFKLKKWDGTTETTIATTQTTTKEGGVSETTFRETVQFVIDTETRFNKGDTLRLTVEHWWASDSATSDHTSGFYFNPSSDTQDLRLLLPFKLII